jgi:hypothetical protein
MLSLVRNMFLNQQQRTVAIGLGLRRVIALSVPQFALAATCVIGTPHIAMLPASMARPLASCLRLTVYKPLFKIQAITILQLWHARSDRDPGSSLLRTIVRQAGKGASVRSPSRDAPTPLDQARGAFQSTFIVALETFLQSPHVRGHLSSRLSADEEWHEQFAHPVPLEVERDRDARPCPLLEGLDGNVHNCPDRPVEPVNGPTAGRRNFRDP